MTLGARHQLGVAHTQQLEVPLVHRKVRKQLSQRFGARVLPGGQTRRDMDLVGQPDLARRVLATTDDQLGDPGELLGLRPRGERGTDAIELRSQILGHRPHRGPLVTPVGLRPLRHPHGFADPDERTRPEARLGVVDESDGDSHEILRSPVVGRLERDPGGSRPEWLQGHLVMADALGEHGHHLTLPQQRVAGGERRDVAGPGSTIDRPVHRDDTGQLQERPQGRDLEQGRFAQEPRVAAECRHEEKAVDEPVGVVGHQHDRSRGGEVLAVLDLDAAEEHPHEHAGQRGH